VVSVLESCRPKRNKRAHVLPCIYSAPVIPADNPPISETCPTCDGAGRALYLQPGGNDREYETCGTCHGFGWIRANGCSYPCDSCRRSNCAECRVAQQKAVDISRKYGTCQ
jgi:DnaJ-class molecular chaperone